MGGIEKKVRHRCTDIVAAVDLGIGNGRVESTRWVCGWTMASRTSTTWYRCSCCAAWTCSLRCPGRSERRQERSKPAEDATVSGQEDGGRSASLLPSFQPQGPTKAQKYPSLVSDDLPSHGLHRSTLGARGLNFWVRNGTRCTSPAIIADQRGIFSCEGKRVPSGPHSTHIRQKIYRIRDIVKRRARPISAARLNALLHVHLRSINLVVYEGPYRKENSSWDGLPA